MNKVENILFIGDPLSSLKLKSDSSLALAQAALKCGKKVYWCEASNIAFFNNEIVVLNSQEILAASPTMLDYRQGGEKKIKFSFFQFCFVRKDPPFDEEYKNLCWILSCQNKVKIINGAEALLAFHEKALQWRAAAEGFLENNQIIPTCLTRDLRLIENFCDEFAKEAKIICKPWLGHGGESVFLFDSKELLLNFLGKNYKELFLIQPFLPEITSVGDRRVILANGKVICDYVRLPAPGKIASNGAQGGSAVLRPMSAEQNNISLKVAQFLKAKGILFAGLDLIGNFVGEINITSPTGIRTYEALANCREGDMASQILNTLLD